MRVLWNRSSFHDSQVFIDIRIEALEGVHVLVSSVDLESRGGLLSVNVCIVALPTDQAL